ncbi:MAG: hypothetical protein WEG56_03740 [Chloroflexota bacterium]
MSPDLAQQPPRRARSRPRVRAVIGDRAYRGLANLGERKRVNLEVKAPPKAVTWFTPLWPLYKIEHTIAQLGRWRRLSRYYEGTEASARAWLEVASVGYLAWRARSDPASRGRSADPALPR